MTFPDAVAAKLRDPWFRVALALTVLLPLAALVFTLATRGVGTTDAYVILLGTAGPAANLLPLLVLFLVAASPESATRQQALVAYGGDVVMLLGAFALGWGVPSLVLVVATGLQPSGFVALALYLVEVSLLIAAWRGLAAALDSPGLDSGRLHRRLFLAWLALSAVLPFLSSAAYVRGRFGAFSDVPAWALLVDALSPESTFNGLVAATFPRTNVMMDPQQVGAWFSPWTFGPILLAWAVVPLLLALRQRPVEAPPAPPEEPAST